MSRKFNSKIDHINFNKKYLIKKIWYERKYKRHQWIYIPSVVRLLLRNNNSDGVENAP